jgi:hypothetical protein
VTNQILNREHLRKAQAAAPYRKFETQALHAQKLYGSKYNAALDSFHVRYESMKSEDREALRKSREARAQHDAFFTRLDMDPKDAAVGLGKLLEYESRPRTVEDQQKIAERTFESLRMDLGSTEEAQAAVANHNKFMEAYAQACPYFAERARLHGANVDADIVRLGARYGAALK